MLIPHPHTMQGILIIAIMITIFGITFCIVPEDNPEARLSSLIRTTFVFPYKIIAGACFRNAYVNLFFVLFQFPIYSLVFYIGVLKDSTKTTLIILFSCHAVAVLIIFLLWSILT